MEYKPPLRNYGQMTRVVRDKPNSSTSYQLGSAYGETTDQRVNPTEQRIRTLNSMNVPSTSLRRPERPAVEGFLSTRASSTLFHDLNDTTQQYVSGQGGPQGVRRSDGEPGTKMRTEIGRDAFSKTVFTAQPFATQATPQSQSEDKQSKQTGQSVGGFNAFK